jgi:flavin-dependent dehydrogenase
MNRTEVNRTERTRAMSYDVVVVGARCAGAATGMLLGRSGLRVLLLDRARRGSDTLSTHALMRGGALQLARWGLLDAVVAAGTPPVRQTSFHYCDETVRVSLKPYAGIEALYAPRRTVLDALLVDAAEAAGVRTRFGVDVTGLLRGPGGRVVGVTGRDRDGGRVEVRAPLTVGADGVRSLVARLAGAPVERLGGTGGAIVYGHWSGLEVEGYEWWYRPGASAGLIPTNGGEVCVFAGLPAPRFRSEVAGDLAGGYRRLLAEVTAGAGGRFAAARPPARLRAFPGRPGFLRRVSGPGWALVGDAGSFLDPLSTHGITDALRDAELLARAVLSGDFGGYQAERDRLSNPLFDVADEVASYRWSTTDLRGLLLRLSSAMSLEVETIVRWGAVVAS